MIGETEELSCQIPVRNKVIISVILLSLTVLFFCMGSFGVGRERFIGQVSTVVILVGCFCWYRHVIRAASGKTHSLHVDSSGITTPFSRIFWKEVTGIEAGIMEGIRIPGKHIDALRISLHKPNGVAARRGWLWKLLLWGSVGEKGEVVPAFLLDLPPEKVAIQIELLRNKYT